MSDARKVENSLLVKEFRVKAGLTQREFGKKVGLSQTQVGKIESGLHVSLYRLNQIARVLNCRVSNLINDGDKDFGPDESLANDIHQAICFVDKNKSSSLSRRDYTSVFVRIYNQICEPGKLKIEVLQEENIHNVIKLVQNG